MQHELLYKLLACSVKISTLQRINCIHWLEILETRADLLRPSNIRSISENFIPSDKFTQKNKTETPLQIRKQIQPLNLIYQSNYINYYYNGLQATYSLTCKLFALWFEQSMQFGEQHWLVCLQMLKLFIKDLS